ncbi:hypothetical protein PHMEG_00021737 [Phytophthora megakarya]|uniref:Uncharacterized protein n=1 Tax=Phytophthora megakarya TaxID=4795 RepID=A0A225VL48_9STRA|nr:hypothetical protein PHMEG_00021737 [Phytophthora megakarya]
MALFIRDGQPAEVARAAASVTECMAVLIFNIVPESQRAQLLLIAGDVVNKMKATPGQTTMDDADEAEAAVHEAFLDTTVAGRALTNHTNMAIRTNSQFEDLSESKTDMNAYASHLLKPCFWINDKSEASSKKEKEKKDIEKD